MIIVNGNIELKLKTGGGIDPERGYPIPVVVNWSKPIDCQYRAVRRNLQAKTIPNEAYIDCSYTILVDLNEEIGEELRLNTSSGKCIGEFSVINIERLLHVGITRITV
jgi:hypothetical protein